MNEKPYLIHTHFHKRKTGLTRSVEIIFPFFKNKFNAFIYGYNIEGRKINTRNLLTLLFSKKETVVHCHRNNELQRFLFFRLLGAKFKLIATRHAETIPSKFTKFLLKKADIIITLTKSMSEYLGLQNIVVGHGVNIDMFFPDNSVKLSQIRQKNIITCAGRVRKSKGQKVLLEAVAPLLKTNKNWALVIAGKVEKSNFLKELKKIVSKHDIENQVYFLGETSQIINVYQASHTVVIPSFSEGFSLVCAEAMACGCNVVATKDVGVHADMITHQKNGYLFKKGSAFKLQKILQQIIEKKLLHLGNEARKEIIQNWSSQKESENLTAIYYQAIKTK